MKYSLIAVAASLCAMPMLSAAPGDSAFGGGLMDDLFTPYDDTAAIELPGEDTRKPSVSRSTQLVGDEIPDTWETKSGDSASSGTSGQTAAPSAGEKTGTSARPASSPSRTSSGSSRSPGASSREDYDDSDSSSNRTVFDLDENNPFKNNYKYKDTERRGSGSATSGIDEVSQRIKDILHDSAPKQGGVLDSMDDLMRSGGREAAREAPVTPDRWNRAPNGWFCNFDDAMEKAGQSGKAVAVFFHSSDNENSRKFKSERMENSKFKNKMRGRLLVVYMDYPDDAGSHKDRRNKDQVEHNSRIAEKFHVSNYPTLIILDSSGSEIGRINERKNSVAAFVDNVDRIVPQKEEKEKEPGEFKVGGSLKDIKLSGDPSSN